MRYESYIPAGRAKGCGERLRGGFTLTEVLIAIIVMGIGLTMAAALFPAAMKETETSINDVNGTIIAANGLDIAASVLTQDDVSDPNFVVLTDHDASDPTPEIPTGLEQYGDNANRGFVILGRHLGDDQYQLVSVAYWKNAGGDVTAEKLAGFSVDPNDPTGLTVTHDDGLPHDLRVGSPVIADDAAEANTIGEFAVILSVSDDCTTGYLDREFSSSVSSAWVIQEDGMDTKSPAIATLVRTVMLKQP